MKRGISLKHKRMLYGYAFISPWLIGFCFFFLVNLANAFYYSLCNVVPLPEGGIRLDFIGLENFRYALKEHASFNRILAESIGNTLIDVTLIVFFSLFVAIILNQKFRGRIVVRAIFFLPVILLSSAITEALESALNVIIGGVSSIPPEIRDDAGFSARHLMNTFIRLGFPAALLDYVEGAVNRVYEIVRASGVQILIFLAALQSIPVSIYEMAKIEGANSYETFWKITFPMVSPLILTNVIYTIIDSFIVSEVVDTAYTTAFTSSNLGLSSAMSVLSSASVCIILLVVGYIISKRTFYQN
ncbi:MAG: carbohydrate ABC transporter permease [Acetivibrionales bacterium]